jgi:hypothetical protein
MMHTSALQRNAPRYLFTAVVLVALCLLAGLAARLARPVAAEARAAPFDAGLNRRRF